MFYAPLSNPNLKRTIRPLYAQHQATTYAGFLDPDWNRSFDILPGTVMVRKEKEIFTPYTGSNGVPFGLADLFCAPNLGVDEVTATGSNLFTVWVGSWQAVFEVLAPAFDQSADWQTANSLNDGSVVLLTGNSHGLLTPHGATNANAVAELVDVETTDKILIRLNRFNPATVPGSSAYTG